MGIGVLFALVSLMHAPERTITGRVTDVKSGEPIYSATVSVEGTQLAVLTGRDGSYRIVRVPTGRQTITARGIGYAPGRSVVDVPDSGNVTVNFALRFTVANLQEIVVTGTAGDQTRAAQGAVIASINTDSLNAKAPIATITEALEGRVPGVDVQSASGTVGASPRINIRGSASIDLSNAPIVFVDGVRMDAGQRNDIGNHDPGLERLGGQSVTALNDINPDDIASIEIVKGPAAATLYGADASAGVIQIITKKGQVGAHGFSQSVTGEWNQVQPNFTPYANYTTCATATIAPGVMPLCTGKTAGTVVSDNPLVDAGVYKDGNLGSLLYNGQGGGDNFGYFVSAGASNEQGIAPNSEYQRRSGRASLHWVITPRLSVDATASLSRNYYKVPMGDDSQYGYLVASTVFYNPFDVVVAPNGSKSGGVTEPLAGLEAIQNTLTTIRTTPTVQIQYNPWSFFTNRVTVGADLSSTHADTFFPVNDQSFYSGNQANGYIEDTQHPVNTYTFDYLGNVRAKLGAGGWITSNLSFGSQYIDIVNNSLTGVGIGLTANSSNLVSSAASSQSFQTFSESKSLGLLAQEELAFGQALFIQGGFRVDENSAFGTAYGWFFLPKVSGSLVLSELPFWSHGLGNVISTFRLRSAYGTTGRSPTPGAALQTYSPFSYVNADGSVGPGIIQASPGNVNLKPERGREFEAGFDAGFLHDRFGVEFTYFNKNTSNLLLQNQIPPSLAFATSPFVNLGEVDNSGLEFSLRATPVQTKNVSWDVTWSGNTLRNSVNSLGGVTIPNSAFVSADLTTRYTPGFPLSAYFSSKITKVDTVTGVATLTNTPVYDGSQFPTFLNNLSTTVTLFHVVRVYGLLNSQRGGKILNIGQYLRDAFQYSAQMNLPVSQGGYSTAEKIRRFGPYETADGTPVGSVLTDYIQRTDFTRLGELSVSLILPGEWARMLHGTGATLTVGGRNLALWKASDYQGYDPEVLANTSSTQFLSYEEATVPNSRRWFARLNVQF